MITLFKNATQNIYVTSRQNLSVSTNFVGIFFTNRTTNEVVKFMFNNFSTTLRFDEMSIVVNTYFSNFDEGFWDYATYETATNNINSIDTDSTPLETGLMYLYPASEFEPTKYNGQSNTFYTYGN
jgi:hypothetical protein